MKFGYGRRDFTPVHPVAMNSARTGTEIGDVIYATCLAWSDGKETVLAYSLDLRGCYEHFSIPVREAVSAKTGIPFDHIMISVTHNHSCPDISNMPALGIRDWYENVGLPAIVAAGEDALADLAEISGAEGGKTEVKHVSFVRRFRRADGTWNTIGGKENPSPIVAAESQPDPELRAVRIRREGKKDVVLVNFQCHAANGLGVVPTVVHSDFVGPLRRAIEKDGNTLAFYQQGASGNVNNSARLPEDKELCPGNCFKIGGILGEAALKALEQATPLTLDRVILKNAPLTCTVNHTKSHLADKARELRKITDPKERQEKMFEFGFQNRYEVGAIIKRSAFGEFRDMPLSTLALGDLAFGYAPVELFDACGKAFRDASPYEITFFCGYSNAAHSYMPSAAAFPHEGYEVMECHYVGGTGEMIALKLAAMLHESKKGL